tara:strand:- start:1255 stop:1485 length:231 start_codon:yes stop_codon:yes gene_type:complete
MIFSTRELQLSDRVVPAWTALPEAAAWPALKRLMQRGALIDVPDDLLDPKLRSGRPSPSVKGKPKQRAKTRTKAAP